MTAIEWLVNVVQSCIAPDYIPKEIIEQAKEMEKQQIIDAHTIGYIIGGGNGDLYDCKEYYNETYGSKGSDVMTPENHIGVLSEAVRKETTSSQTEISNAGKDTADYIDRHIIESMKELAREGFKPQASEISDEEIEEMLFHHSNEYAYGFKDAIKWYREQLKSK